jgi:predicted ArsR family transcriptional regulator
MDAGDADIPLNRDNFLRTLVRELSGTLEDVVGVEDASGYISVVGGAIGGQLDDTYKAALGVERLNKTQIGEVLVDLKQRIHGDFYVHEEREDRIVFASRSCPFGEYVLGRPSLCMMTSNVFGRIAANNNGYARVDIEKAIARGDKGCLVTVYLRPGDDSQGPEYFGDGAEEAS